MDSAQNRTPSLVVVDDDDADSRKILRVDLRATSRRG